MRKLASAAAVTIVLASFRVALAAGIGDVAWNESNLRTLRNSDKSAVARFVNQGQPGWATDIIPAHVGEFGWFDVLGDGNYELVVTLDFSGRDFFNTLVLYWRDSSGRVTSQEIKGWELRDLKKVVRDLNRNGQKELIVPTLLISYSTAETFTWPAVYRLKKGKYVEASRDFSTYYDDEVLPQIDREISGSSAKTIPGLDEPETQAVATLERDQILRVTGRNPTAGLQQAYQWMNSEDPKLLQDAAATFQSIPGHEHEARSASDAAEAAWKRALASRRGAREGS